MTLFDQPDETELRRLMGTRAYWDDRHPDYAQLKQTVAEGFRRLYPSTNNGTISNRDETFQAYFNKARQWGRDNRELLMAQATQGGSNNQPVSRQPIPTIPLAIE